MIDAKSIIGSHDVLFITLDSLRYDVAQEALLEGLTPNFARLLPADGWELRHTPGNFTYSAHQAFFAGFLPTPPSPGNHPRLFAAKFAGSETSTANTAVFDTPDIISGFAKESYRTICIGGVGFFNKQNPLGSVLPDMFHESHWSTEMGVTSSESTKHQIDQAVNSLSQLGKAQRVFLFINVSALHQPNCIFKNGTNRDSKETQKAALSYVDSQIPRLLEAMAQRAPFLSIICSDHGTAYGEDGFTGHRINHPVVWNVPYTEFITPAQHKREVLT